MLKDIPIKIYIYEIREASCFFSADDWRGVQSRYLRPNIINIKRKKKKKAVCL